jgi:2,3-bisphosphoglycerate-dependent phosphoglycerate mutase
MNNLILVRHGQSLWNKERRFTGWADIDLTDEAGKSEAKQAGLLIKDLNIKFDAFFSSQLIRAIRTLDIIKEILNKSGDKINKAWELNERHYGDLTGLNKDETIKKYGAKQVKIWRRSFNIAPPPMSPDHPYINKINTKILSESLKDTFERVIPFYEKNIEPLISLKKNILISFHGNSCRALLKKIFNISNKKIVELEIPTGNPLLINFDENLKVNEYKYLDIKRAKKILFNV